jgi:hypothetical protein
MNWSADGASPELHSGDLGFDPIGSSIAVSKTCAMGMMKNYLLTLLQQCSEEQFGQDAIEWAIEAGIVRLSYGLDADVRSVMSRYDEIIEAYRRSTALANEGLRKAAPAPMKRAGTRRQIKTDNATTSTKRKNAA